MKDRLVIFDCYKTLIEAEEVANNTYRATVRELFGIEGGRTDADPTATTIQTVVIEIARKKGVPANEIESKDDIILSEFERFFEIYVKGHVVTLPGVPEILEALRKVEIPNGIYTGDSFRTLDMLLRRAGLDKYFPEDIRSCGSNETPDRTELLRLAIGKAQRKYNFQFSKDGVYVVDDSWRGVKAAEMLGVRSIALGNPQRFEGYGVKPDYLFADLSDHQEVLKIIKS